MIRKLTALGAAALIALGALGGCAQKLVLEETVALEGGWAKSAEEGSMTGLFGTLRNGGSTDLTVERLESEAARTVELHEVPEGGTMRRIEEPVVIPAGGSFELAPGGNHIMLMQLTRELRAGDNVTVTAHFTDGSTATLLALVKDYAGANESYEDVSHDEEDHGAH